jgi:glycine dehydrogenase
MDSNLQAELAALESDERFADRHIGPSDADIAEMLRVVGAASLEDLVDRAVPPDIRVPAPDLPAPAGEEAALAELRDLASRNVLKRSLIGRGYYGTHLPPVIRRNVLENPGWYTAYTPYQSEIAQGRLEALLIFQTMVCELTGMEIANASLLDEATAVAEAVHMAQSLSRAQSRVIAVADDVHLQTRAVLATRAAPLGLTLVPFSAGDTAALRECGPFATVLQYPGTTGAVRDIRAEIAATQDVGALAIVATDLLACALLTPPGEFGADIVVGAAQRFGVPMAFGGPHAAFLATRDAYKRAMPGRLVGVSVDADGHPALRLALQTREQHIRRERATSNICTAQVLLAVIAAFYAVWHGPDGLVRMAERVNLMARMLAGAAVRAGFVLRHASFFDTIALEAAARADLLMQTAQDAGFNFCRLDASGIAVALDETVSSADLDALCAVFGAEESEPGATLPPSLLRQTPPLRSEVFTAHRSEHAMLRFLRRLEGRDISLTRSMIPLGSCTMKLNATAEMLPVSWPGFADLHPFAPPEQTLGTRTLIARLSDWLGRITGLPAVSLQPNAGSQGELAGLLAIRGWHASRGETARDVCLIPASAHGTNPASAALAGFRIVVVACDRLGSIDLADLRAKAAEHADSLAALMITYPSTHGVFEPRIKEVCEVVHARGGQVYMDGANMNAQVALTSPAACGADICHLNLHKTFCIPHGGGGPGVGPICAAPHMAPFLPGHPNDAGGMGPVSAAPFGSAGILPVSYAYIRMMGAEGLRRATQVAILSANYMASRLRSRFPVLFTGGGGLVAHECILDCRAFQSAAGITVEDIAKRLQDYGFHAPTISWPVPGTMMIEPTESESKSEIDRYCDALLAIASEIADVIEGRADRADNPLKHAPHTARALVAVAWPHAYSREQAAFPLPWVAEGKYWPPVARVDNAHGDRHLFCTCTPLTSYAEAAD